MTLFACEINLRQATRWWWHGKWLSRSTGGALWQTWHDTFAARFSPVSPARPPTVRLQESALFAIHIHTYKYIYIHTYVVPARFIMSIEIANCDFSFRDAKLIRDPDTREICGECTVAFWPLLNQISCRFALQLQLLLLLPAAVRNQHPKHSKIFILPTIQLQCASREGEGAGEIPSPRQQFVVWQQLRQNMQTNL